MFGRRLQKKIEKKNRIKCVLFDLGGVLVRIHPEKFFKKIKFDPKNIKEKVTRFESDSSLGIKEPDEILKDWMQEYNINMPLDKCRTYFIEEFIGKKIRGVFKFIKQLQRSGYIIGLLSNTNVLHFEYAFSRIKEFSSFQKLYLSYKLHIMKPDPKIFQHITHDLQFNPDEILFVDDTLTNVEAALTAGWQAIKVTTNDPEIHAIRKKLNK